MDINVIPFFNHASSIFQENFLASLRTQRKKIVAIVSVVFGCLVLVYLISRCCFFKAKALNGEEKKVDSEGNVLEGIFKDDQLHGLGQKTAPDGKIERGEFQEGKLHGAGKKSILHRVLADDEFEEIGEYQNGQLNIGKRTYADGTVEEGKFLNDKLHGLGCRIYRNAFNGMVEEGEFKEGELDGPGKRRSPQAEIIEGGLFSRGILLS